MTTLYLFRQDLRLDDNPALNWALEQGPCFCVYIADPQFDVGQASTWWLHEALKSLNDDLLGALNYYEGQTAEIVAQLVRQFSIDTVIWSRCYEPDRISHDTQLKKTLKEDLGVDCKSFNASLLWEPWEVLKKDKTPYKVFSPFYYKGALGHPAPRLVVKTPKITQETFLKDSASMPLHQSRLFLDKAWTSKLHSVWEVNSKAAHLRLEAFIANGLEGYKEKRNHPSLMKHTSRLSPYLHYGLLSPHQVWYAAQSGFLAESNSKDLDHFLSELGWREFSYYLLYHFPTIVQENFQPKFDAFPWMSDQRLLKAWQKGLTGYPIVDAGMRELYQTGYMHNRVRMITASFLVKNLLQHWHLGRDWFHDCLVDADLASNNASWQWVAGSGADAAPYFRIFNPLLQGEKFDANGEYVKTWVPELKDLPAKWIHRPFEAGESLLTSLNIILGKTYPEPIVDLAQTRDQALALYQEHIRKSPS